MPLVRGCRVSELPSPPSVIYMLIDTFFPFLIPRGEQGRLLYKGRPSQCLRCGCKSAHHDAACQSMTGHWLADTCSQKRHMRRGWKYETLQAVIPHLRNPALPCAAKCTLLSVQGLCAILGTLPGLLPPYIRSSPRRGIVPSV